MTQVPRLYAPTPAQVTANARTIAGNRVASLDGEIGGANGGHATANLDTAPFTLQGEPRRGQDRDHRDDRAPVRHGGLLRVPSRAFGSLVEYYGNEVANDAGPEVRSRRNVGLISRAISTYETNAKIIHGEQEITGTEISIRL